MHRLREWLSGDAERGSPGRWLARVALVLLWPLVAMVILTLATTRYGIGLSPDSAGYVDLAREIRANGFDFLATARSVSKPPGYPIVLAALSGLLAVDPVVAARVLNVGLAGGITGVVQLLLARLGHEKWLPAAGGVACACSVPLLAVSVMAWTEPLFIFSTLAALALLSARRLRMRQVVAAGLLVAAASLTRYAGVVLWPVVATYLILRPVAPVARRLRSVGVFLALCVPAAGLYVVRNLLVSGTALAERAPSPTGLGENLGSTLETMARWFVVAGSTFDPPTLFLLAGAVVGIPFIVGRRSIAAAWRERPVLGLLLLFLCAYLAFIVISSSLVAYDPIAERLLAPIFPPLIIFLLLALAAVGAQLERAGMPGRWAGALVGLLLLELLVGPMRATVESTHAKMTDGAGGFSRRDWRESSLMAHLRATEWPAGTRLFANESDGIYLLCDLKARQSPSKRGYQSEESQGITGENLFERFPQLDGALLIWSALSMRDYLLTPAELGEMAEVEIVERYSDGLIFEINAR